VCAAAGRAQACPRAHCSCGRCTLRLPACPPHARHARRVVAAGAVATTPANSVVWQLHVEPTPRLQPSTPQLRQPVAVHCGIRAAPAHAPRRHARCRAALCGYCCPAVADRMAPCPRPSRTQRPHDRPKGLCEPANTTTAHLDSKRAGLRLHVCFTAGVWCGGWRDMVGVGLGTERTRRGIAGGGWLCCLCTPGGGVPGHSPSSRPPPRHV
jgi:hypothetical protein